MSVNAAELRYAIYKTLVNSMDVASLDSPEPGKPLTISVAVGDPFTLPARGETRYFRVTVEEVTD